MQKPAPPLSVTNSTSGGTTERSRDLAGVEGGKPRPQIRITGQSTARTQRNMNPSRVEISPQRSHVQERQHVRDQIFNLTSNVLKNLQGLSHHLDGVGQPYQKYYDEAKLKNHIDIQNTLSTNHEFYKEQNTNHSISKIKTTSSLSAPYLTFTRTKSRQMNRDQSTHRRPHGIELLSISNEHSLSNFDSPRDAAKRRLKVELDTIFNKRFSSNLVIDTEPDSASKLPHLTTSTSSTMHYNTLGNLKSFPNTETNNNRSKRKELMDDIMHKRTHNIVKLESTPRSEYFDDNTHQPTSNKHHLPHKKRHTSTAGLDSVTYQILALGSKQRKKVQQRLESIAPSEAHKYQQYFLKP